MISSNASDAFQEFLTTAFQKYPLCFLGIFNLLSMNLPTTFYNFFLSIFIKESSQHFPGIFLVLFKNFLGAFLNPPCCFLGVFSLCFLGIVYTF